MSFIKRYKEKHPFWHLGILNPFMLGFTILIFWIEEKQTI